MHMNRMQRLALTATACLGVAASGAQAPTEQPPEVEEVIVTAHPLGKEGLAQASDVLTADELERKMVDTIGATVGNEPGIHNSAYGVGAGRPVIRGLGGARVRIMEEQIDTLDVSVSSGDHAVTVDPFLAERVEILKGSATLLYGSGAIGGVVDVHTGRIPNEVPERIHGALDVRGTGNGSGKNGSFRLDGGSGNVAWHVDAFSRESDDYDIPGFAESAALHAAEGHEEEGHGHEEEAHDEDDDHHDEEGHEEEEEAFGTVPGSASETRGGSVGFSFVGERGFGGISISGLDSEYGIPGHRHAHHEHDDHHEEGHHDEEEHAHEEHDEHENEDDHGEESPPVVVLEQTRIDLEAGLADPFDGFESLSLRLGINDYEHVENEAGEVGTAFSNSAWEGRAELTHEPIGGWRGAIGMQLSNREFSVAGEEAFTPPVDTSSSGFFWVGERSLGDLGLEAGVRYDRVEHSPANGQSRDFGGLSASLGLIGPFSPNWQGSLLADYSTRAPVGEELFSDSPHPGTGVFEVGDANLDTEQARNLAATLTGGDEGWSLVATTYYTSFAGFIYQGATGEEREGFDVRRYSQADATFTGFEVEGRVTVAEWGVGTLDLGAFYDLVSPEIDVSGNDNLPLMPPSRIGVSLEFTGTRLRANVDYIRASEQDEVAEFELPTDSYDDLRARIAWRFRPGERTVDVFLAGRNLTNDEQRLHTSVVKDMVPQPGRTIEAGLRMRF
ncbi:MAG: TonB-dependent receptor [Gammaproteobacteria bacterium]|nr:TonB-dependent receptor [Gammaproteobacteria bacterium]